MCQKGFKQLIGKDGEHLAINVVEDDVLLSLQTEDGEEYHLETDIDALVNIYNQLGLLLEDECDDEDDEDEDEDDEEEEEEEEEEEVKPKKRGKKK